MPPVKRLLLFCLCTLLAGWVPAQEWKTSLRHHYRHEDSSIRLSSGAGGQVSQIILIRHAEPDLEKKGCRNREEAIRYFRDYDSAGVVPFDRGPLDESSITTGRIYHSSLPRAGETARKAFERGSYEFRESDNFREFERKPMWFCNIRIPTKCWTTGSRLWWFVGLNDKGIESFREAKGRARGNAFWMTTAARKENQLILVAHGLHNKYVKKYLRKLGWKKVYSNGNGYLSVKIMAIEGGR